MQRLYAEAPLRAAGLDSAGFVAALARLPLIGQPGAAWDYSHATDVLGRVVEIVCGESLGVVLRDRILGPLGMRDTGFFAPPESPARLAEPFEADPDAAAGAPVDVVTRHASNRAAAGSCRRSRTTPASRRCSRSAARSTARDLGPQTLAFMTADHLGPDVRIGTPSLLPPGHGFGLGFAVRRETGLAPTPGTPGEYYWGGIAGTAFWIAPEEQLVALMMIQAPGQRDFYRQLFRNLVHAALA